MDGIPRHVRMHMLLDVLQLHLPPAIERRLAETVDLMIRQGYKYRDPSDSRTWSAISGETIPGRHRIVPVMAAAVGGNSGVGKSVASFNCLNLFPVTIFHKSFPRLSGGLHQWVSVSANVPASGKSTDLARELMVCSRESTGTQHFDDWLRKDVIRDGMRALDEWRQVAKLHFLGILHLDEVQNFFRLASIRQRKNRRGSGDFPELAIVEDQCLRWVLNIINTSQFPLLLSGTPDGMEALTRRLSTLERIGTMGYHQFHRFSDPKAPAFRQIFLARLGRYQYVKKRLAVDDALAEMIEQTTAGVPRIVMAQWVAAHRIAFERKDDDLRLDDFKKAALTWLAPLAPAVQALRSGDPAKMARYEDLVVRDTAFWSNFWKSVQGNE
jgi:hypothetical protein